MKVEAAPETVDKTLADIARRNRELVEITAEELGDRGAAQGEVLTVDYVGRVEGVEFPGGTGNDIAVDVGGEGFIPGFTEQLEGMKPGETRTIEVTFPAEYGAPNLAGKPATFEITGKKLSRSGDAGAGRRAGQEAWLRRPGRRCATPSRRRIQGEYDQMSRLRLKRQLLDALAGVANFASPEGMVEQEFSQIWQRLETDRKEGRLDDDDKDKDEETLKSEYRAIAERRVRLGLLLAEIGRANSITVAADEMARAMRMEAMRYPGQEQQIMEFFRQNPRASETLRGPIYEEKVVDFVLELAKVEDTSSLPRNSRRSRRQAERSPPRASDAAKSRELLRSRSASAVARPLSLALAVWPVGVRRIRLSMQPSLT